MRTYVVMYSPEARLDIKDIYAYIAYKLQEKIVAEKQVRRIRNAIKDLDYFPLKYEVFKGRSNDDRNIHKMPVDNYTVFYSVDESMGSVIILRIVYGGIDLNNMSL